MASALDFTEPASEVDESVGSAATSSVGQEHKLRAAGIFAWTMWSLALVADLGFVGYFGSDVPWRDEWELVPYLTSRQPITKEWLWSLFNGHRIPLIRLASWAAWQSGNSGLRLQMAVGVLLMAAASALLMATAARLRGRASVADAFFPVALLHWGHHENLLMAFQVQTFASTTLACVILAVFVRRRQPSRMGVLLVGCCLLLLPLCGTNGLVLTLPLALWLAVADRRSRRSGLRLGPVLAAGVIALVAAYGIGYEAARPIAKVSVDRILRAALEMLSMAFGPAGIHWWPISGMVILGLCLGGLLLLASVACKRSKDRIRLLGLLLFLAGMLALAGAIGWGRAGLGAGAGFANRYGTLAVPVLCWVLLVWERYGGRIGRLVPMTLCAIFVAILPYNLRDGLREARHRRALALALNAEAAAGLPSDIMARRHAAEIFPNETQLTDRLEMLRAAGRPPFDAH
jgi:hypothetical protein